MTKEAYKAAFKEHIAALERFNEWEKLHPRFIEPDVAFEWNAEIFDTFTPNKKPDPPDVAFIAKMHELLSHLPG